jgi:hypothetical protein
VSLSGKKLRVMEVTWRKRKLYYKEIIPGFNLAFIFSYGRLTFLLSVA